MEFVLCTHDAHAQQILAILNEAIANSTALYDYEPRSMESMAGWFGTKELNRFPVIGAIDHGRLAGFASYGTFRAWPRTSTRWNTRCTFTGIIAVKVWAAR
jgi:phosphinothricin acetyltransferase